MIRLRTLVILFAVGASIAATIFWQGAQRPSGPTAAQIGETMAAYFRDQRQTLAGATSTWDSVAAPAFTLYMPNGSFAASHVVAYRAQVDSAISHALRLLTEPMYPAHLRVYYVGSREEMKAIVGSTYTGTTDAEVHTVILVASDSTRPAHRHEIMHAVSLLTWGQPGGPDGDAAYPTTPGLYAKGGWLREGVAAAAEDRCGPYSYTAVAAQMHAQGERLSLDSLVLSFYEQDGLSAYLQAGSLVNYLLKTHGVERFRRLWRSAGSDFKSAYGKSAAVIEADWQQWLAAVPDSARPTSVKALRQQGCS